MKLRIRVAKDYVIDTDNLIFEKLEREYYFERGIEEGIIEEAVKAIQELTNFPFSDGNYEPGQEYITAVWDENTGEGLLEF